MKNEIHYTLSRLDKAFDRLSQGAKQAKDELSIDGVIQRFEFTFELFWKSLKIILEYKGIESKTPRDVLQEAFRLEWLKSEETYLARRCPKVRWNS